MLVAASCAAPTRTADQVDPSGGDHTFGRSVEDAAAIRRQLETHRGDRANVERLALEVLTQGRPASVDVLANHLASSRDPATLNGLSSALAKAPLRPPAAFAKVLLDRLVAFNPDGDEVIEGIAEALGRSLDQGTAQRAIKAATATEMPVREPQRCVVIRALGKYRNQGAAEALIELISRDQPQSIQHAAFEALAHMTGRWDLGMSVKAWRDWHTRRCTLSPSDWIQQLMEELQGPDQLRNVARQNSVGPDRAVPQVTIAQLTQAVADLVETRRRLYRASGAEDQLLMLTDWLGDERPPIRLLALQLAEDRELPNEVGEPFREVLRALAGDRLPQIRRRATLLLYILNDAAAADEVARRVSHELEPEVLEAYLLLLSRVPRAAAVDPALSMMANEKLRGPASAMLDVAIERHLLDRDQLEQVTICVRDQLDRPNNVLPEPELVRLLARVATQDDWHRIEGWLNAQDEKVKDAAARAWADSQQPVLVLARRAGDKHIRQIAITAARLRGRDGPTMMALMEHRPADEQVLAAWRRTLGEMAKHVPVATIVAADRRLGHYDGTAELREQLLTRAVGRLVDNSGPNRDGPLLSEPLKPLSRDEARLLIDLLISRANLLLNRGEPRAALADLHRIEKEQFHFDADRQRRFRLALLRAHLAGDQAEQAVRVAEALLRDRVDESGVQTLGEGIAGQFLKAADRHLGADQPIRAATLLKALRRMLDAGVTERLNGRITDMEARISAAATIDPVPSDEGMGEDAPTGS